MVRTASTMVSLGTPAPDFRLPDTTGKVVSRGAGRRAGRQARLGRPETEPRLQRQVETRQRAGLTTAASTVSGLG